MGVSRGVMLCLLAAFVAVLFVAVADAKKNEFNFIFSGMIPSRPARREGNHHNHHDDHDNHDDDDDVKPVPPPAWGQWGRIASHNLSVDYPGMEPEDVLADIVYDPFVPQFKARDTGHLYAHYQVPMVDGDWVYMMNRFGSFPTKFFEDGLLSNNGWVEERVDPVDGSTFLAMTSSFVWAEAGYRWEKSYSGERTLTPKWTFNSTWMPSPYGSWEAVFHPAVSGEFVYVPMADGSLMKVDKISGKPIRHVKPFAEMLAGQSNGRDTFLTVTSPLTVDKDGNILYTATWVNLINLTRKDAWLVRIAPCDSVEMASFKDLFPNAPEVCNGTFAGQPLPWPPSYDAVPPTMPCGFHGPAINFAPTIDPKTGVIYLGAVAENLDRGSHLLAVNPDLTPKWQASLKVLTDGCNVTMLPNGQLGGCREGSRVGVDPATNDIASGRLTPDSSGSAVVAPDGSILLGAFTRYNWARGHTFKFSPEGEFLAAYDFGWDSTPAVWAHDGTYDVIIKDNWYEEVGSYCNDPAFCTETEEEYYMSWLDADLKWKYGYESENHMSCFKTPEGAINCTEDHPYGFEWCINAPVVDSYGVVYANSEDGNLYAIDKDGKLIKQIFLDQALGSAYTPMAVGPDGTIYTQNAGHLFAVSGDGPAGKPYSRK